MRVWRRRRPAGRRSGLISDFTPPEGVPLTFHVAPLGARAMAQFVDVLLTLAFVGSVVGLLAIAFRAPWSLTSGLGALLFFAIRAPYYVLAEIFWQGRTLGKSMTGLRVISADGRSLTPKAVVIRNFMKEAEIFAPLTYLIVAPTLPTGWQIAIVAWVSIILSVPLFSARRQRIGDIAADTLVVVEPQAILLPDLAASAEARREPFAFMPHNLEHYGVYELQTLEKLLHAPPAANEDAERRRAQTLASVVETIRGKIGYAEPVREADHGAFLQAFYVAQRRHLEQRQLMGERRADKFHARDRRPPDTPVR